MGEQLSPAQVDLILRDAASRIKTVVDGFTKVYQGSAGETVWNGAEELPTLAKLLTGFANRLAVIGIDGLVDRGIFELGQDYALLDAARPSESGDYYVCTEAVTDATLAQADDPVHWTPLAQFAGNTKAEADPLQELGGNLTGGAPAYAKLASAAAFGERIDVLRLIPNVNGNHRKILSGRIGDQEDFTANIKAGSDFIVEKATGGSAPTIVVHPGNFYVSGNLLHANAKAVGLVGAGAGATNFQLRPEFDGNLVTLEALGFGPTVQRAAGTLLPQLLRTGTIVGDFSISGDHDGTGVQNGIVSYGTVDEFLIQNYFAKYLRGSFLRLGDWKMSGLTQLTNGAFRESALFNVGCHNCGFDGSPSALITTKDISGVGDGSNQVDIYKMKLAFPAGLYSKLLDMPNYHASRVLRRIVFFGLQTHGSYQLGTTPDDANFYDRQADLFAIRGNCDGIRAYGWRANGGGPSNQSYCAVIEPIDDPLASQGIAQNISLQGDISNTDFGILVTQGKNVTVDVNNAASIEQVRVGPAAGPGIQGKIMFRQPAVDAAKVFIDPAVRANVDLYEDGYGTNHPPSILTATQPSSITTTSTGTLLQIAATTPTANALGVAVTGNTQVAIQATNYNNGTGASPTVRGRKAGGTSTAPTAVAANTQLARFQGVGHDGTSFPAGSGEVIIESSEAHTPSAKGTRIKFAVTPNGSTTMAEQMRLGNSGNLLIGTTTDDGAAGLQTPKIVVYGAYPSTTIPTSGVSEGSRAFMTNARKPGEAAGVGTGLPVYRSQSVWRDYATHLAPLT